MSQARLRRDPSCLECRHDTAEAQFSLALADTSGDIADVGSRLADAVKVLQDVGTRRNSYSQDAVNAAATLKLFMDDELPAMWGRVIHTSDPDERLAALIQHHSFFGAKCRHPISEELETYVAHYRTLTAAAQFQKLMLFERTPVAETLLGVYLSGRLASSTKASDRLAILRQARVNVSDTNYVASVDARYRAELNAFFEQEQNPNIVDEVCRQLDSTESARCGRLSRSLWQARLALAINAHEKYEICKQLEPGELRNDCTVEVARAASGNLQRDDSVDDVQFAERLCRLSGDAQCDRELKIKAYRWAAEDAFSHLDTFGLDGVPYQASHSVEAWRAYITLFDRIAQVTLGTGETLKSTYPEVHRQAAARLANAKTVAARRLRAEKAFCDEAMAARRSLSDIDYCIAVIGDVAQQNQSNLTAAGLLRQLYRVHAERSADRQ